MIGPLPQLGKILIIVGILLVVIGLLISVLGKSNVFGKLPGDIYIKKPNFTFYFPITTSIIISIILSVIAYFIFRK